MNYLDQYFLFLKTEKKLSNHTIESYTEDLNKFRVFINKDLSKITKEDIQEYIIHLRKTINPKSVNRHISSLKGFYKFLIEENILKESPLEHTKALKTPKNLPKYLSVQEIEQLLDFPLENAFDYRNKAMLEVMYATGLRVSELVNLEYSSVDLYNSIIRITGKGKKERIIPIGETASYYLKSWKANNTTWI